MASAPSSMSSLVETIRRRGTQNDRVLSCLSRFDRAAFVPSRERAHAYQDAPVPIPEGQVTTQPSLIAQMVEALELSSHDKVLEIGTGYGFQTALLSCLCKEVYSIERFKKLSEKAWQNLVAAGVQNAVLRVGDGTRGLSEFAPFDAIICSAASLRVPQALIDQLLENGRLVIPIGPGGDETVQLFRKGQGELWKTKDLTPASFVPLVEELAAPFRKAG